jgi:hypothetical protein
MARASTARTREVLVVTPGDDQADESPTKGIALFAGDDGVVGIAVYRMEPIEEGTVGVVPPDSDEETIRRRWGGGVYRISAKGSDGKIKGTRTITVGGDPKFESKDASRRYRIKMGELEDVPPTPAAPAPQLPPQMGITEILALVTQSHAQQMDMMRLQMQAAKVEADEREMRARREADEREARARREAEESRERDRTFNSTMLQMVKGDAKAAASTPLEMVTVLMQGLKLGRQLGAGAEETEKDPVALLIQNLPGIIEHGKGLVQASNQAAAVQQNPQGGARLTGPVAGKLSAAVQGLIGRGYSQDQALAMAEQALSLGVDALAQVPNAQPAPPPPPPPRPAAAPALATAGRNGTPKPSRATPRR